MLSFFRSGRTFLSSQTSARKFTERIFIGREKSSPRELPILVHSKTPREIVADLDKYVVGQEDAKKSVAISLRNRWRRMHVPEELKNEITPMNILLIGATGTGKTEISRRLAKMVDAPFVKVEATKYTEVGIVGQSAEDCIKELAATGYKMELDRKRKELKPIVKEKVEIEILSRIPGSTSSKNRETLLQSLRDGEFENTLIDVTGFQGKKNTNGKQQNNNLTVTLGNVFQSPTQNNKNALQKMAVSEARDLMHDFFLQQAINLTEISRLSVIKVEQSGIVFLDEIDKIAGGGLARTSGYSAVKGEGVQKELLALIEGTNVQTEHGIVNTEHILFIASGAFHYSSPSDLLPELQGRLPIKVSLNALGQSDFEKILTETEANLIYQTRCLFKAEDIELTFTNCAVEEIAKTSVELNKNVENIGARRLRAVVSKVTEELSFEASDLEEKHITIDRNYVISKLEGLTQKLDLAKYVL